MKQTISIFCLIFLIGCSQSEPKSHDKLYSGNSSPKSKDIDLGQYVLNVPSDFEIEKQDGIDSNVGILRNGEIEIHWDYGYYSNRLALSVPEYLQHSMWWSPAVYKYMNGYNSHEKPRALKVIEIRKPKPEEFPGVRNADIVVDCKLDTINFSWPITLSDDTKKHEFIIDTTGSVIRKIVSPKTVGDGYFGVHLVDTSTYNPSINSAMKLTISTRDTLVSHEKTIMDIFKSVKKKEKRHANNG